MVKIGRNDPCPCGSGKKYKHCCLKNPQQSSLPDRAPHLTPVDADDRPPAWEEHGHSELDDADLDDPLYVRPPDDELRHRAVLMNPIMLEKTIARTQRALAMIPEGANQEEYIQHWKEQRELPDLPATTPLEAAQDLMYEAWDTDDAARQIELAYQALEETADCADAYTILAKAEADTLEKSFDLQRQAVEAGERAVGPERIADESTDLSDDPSAWPYLRARLNLAYGLMEREQGEEAVPHLEDILRLDHTDSQEARYPLLALYLQEEDEPAVRKLAKQFSDDDSASWMYADALLAYQNAGDNRKARQLLDQAIDANPLFGGALSNLNVLLYSEVDAYSPHFYLEFDGFDRARAQIVAWAMSPGALTWMIERFNARFSTLPADIQELLLILSTLVTPPEETSDLPPTLGYAGTSHEPMAMDVRPETSAQEPPMPEFDRRTMERQQAQIQRAIDELGIETPDELNDFLDTLRGTTEPSHYEPRNELERAQDVFYDALDAEGAARLALARQALEISEDCADAWVLLAEEEAETEREALEYYKKGMAAGERALGSEGFDELVGQFWGFIETRPYMRAQLGVADSLQRLGHVEDAAGHYEELLRLNPNDNQGVREILLPLYLEMDWRGHARELIDAYPASDVMAVWPYARALLSFMQNGASKRSQRELDKAIETNPYVPRYLLGYVPLDPAPPLYVKPGEPSDAQNCTALMANAWLKTPGALEWLETQTR